MTVQANGTKLKMEVDTGAANSVISEAPYLAGKGLADRARPRLETDPQCSARAGPGNWSCWKSTEYVCAAIVGQAGTGKSYNRAR